MPGDLIVPKIYGPLDNGASPISVSLVIVDTYSPTNYTPVGDDNNVGNHLAGIDVKLGTLTASFSSINATAVVVNSFEPVNYTPATTALSSFLQAIDTRFGKVNLTLPKDFGSQLMPDGDDGKFNADITNMSADGITLSQDNTVYHDPSSASSLKALSTATEDKVITHTTEISFIADQEYELSAYVFVPAADYPNGAAVSIFIPAGTGIIHKTKTMEVSSGTAGKWTKISTRYVPDEDQERVIAIIVTGFTNAKILNFDDVVVSVVPGKRLGYLAPYSIVSLTNLGELYGKMGSPFVSGGGTITTSGTDFDITVAQSNYVIGGRVYWKEEETLTGTGNLDNYVFYNSFNDKYVIKTSTLGGVAPKADDGEQVLWKVAMNLSGTTATTDLRTTAPFSGSQLQPLSISTSHIQANAVTDAKMSTTGVTAASYIFSNITVNATGRITAASSPVTLTSVFANNILQYDSGSSKWVNVSNLTLAKNSSTLSNNSFLDSADLILKGYYDSDSSADISATAYDAVLRHVLSATTPLSKLHFIINDTPYLKYTNKGVLELLNAAATPSGVLSQANQIYSANVTISATTKSVLHVLNEHGHTIKLYQPNAYTLTYPTAARTLNAYTPDTESGAYTGIDNAQVGTPYAKLEDLNALRTAYETLRTSYDNLIQVVRAMGADLQTIGFFGTP